MDRFLFFGSLLGFLAVAMGAFGAHALKDKLTPADFEIFQTAAHYLLIHALAIVSSAVLLRLQPSNRWFRRAGTLFTCGIAIFSGSLFLLVATQLRWWGAVTPLGGICLLLAWAFLAMGALRRDHV